MSVHSSGVGGVQSSDPLVLPALAKEEVREDVGEQLKKWQKRLRQVATAKKCIPAFIIIGIGIKQNNKGKCFTHTCMCL